MVGVLVCYWHFVMAVVSPVIWWSVLVIDDAILLVSLLVSAIGCDAGICVWVGLFFLELWLYAVKWQLSDYSPLALLDVKLPTPHGKRGRV